MWTDECKDIPGPDLEIWVTFESGKFKGRDWLPLGRLKEKVDPKIRNIDEFHHKNLSPGLIPERFRAEVEEKMKKFLSHLDETTELWWYDDIGILCGSSGYAIVRKDDRTKLVDAYLVRRS